MSKYGLSSESKKAVKSTVLALRELLEGEFHPETGEPVPPGGDVARQLARYGISVKEPESLEGDSAPEYLNHEEKEKRKRICAAIKREVSIFENVSAKTALKKGLRAYIRHTSYTWINRLLGLRCMEARGLLKDDRGEPDFVVTPSDDYGGLPRRAWRIRGANPEKWQTAKQYDLQCEAIADACEQLTREIKILFDPDHDYGLIWPSAPVLNTILQQIQDLDNVSTPSPFKSPDFLGWVYQYFQTIEKDLVFEAASKKKKKIEKDDIIPATTIYTEHYMVEYLVQNSLGRLWMEMHPDSELFVNWAYFVKAPEENPPVKRELKKAIDIKLMDPAVGSGHFHLVAFDLLSAMYEEEIERAGQPGWLDSASVINKKDIPAVILENNLFGIDIDARSIQIASLVLLMKARESGYEKPITHLNLVVANSAPFESETWHQFIQDLERQGKHSVARVIAVLGLQLKNLDEFGSLLGIENEMQKVIKEEKIRWIAQAKAGMDQEFLFPEMVQPKQEELPFEAAITDETFFDQLGTVVQKEFDGFYLKARKEGLAEEAIMASDAERGFDFVRLIMQRYDVVYTNPPFMGNKNMGERLKKFIVRAYPQGKRDLYSAFILRCRELSEQNGHVGMVSQQSWMFLRSFVNLRALPKEKLKKAKGSFTGLLRETTIDTLAHLGPRAFTEISGEIVNIALFTFRNSLPKSGHRITAFRLIGPKSSEEKATALIRRASPDTFTTQQRAFLKITESPLAYWLSDTMIDLLRQHGESTRDDKAFVSQGLTTGDVPRFVRFFWECTADIDNWWWYTAGGGYKKWTGNEYLVVDWEDDGFRVREHVAATYPPEKFTLLIKQPETYGRKAIYYGAVARGSLGPRLCEGAIFGDSAPGVIHTKLSPAQLAGILSTRLASFLIRALSATVLTIRDPYVVRLPLYQQPLTADVLEKVQSLVILCFRLKRSLISTDPTERCFIDNLDLLSEPDLLSLAHEAALHSAEGQIEILVTKGYGLEDKEINTIMNETGVPCGWHPLLTDYDSLTDLPVELSAFPDSLIDFLENHKQIKKSSDELRQIKNQLRLFYTSGPGARAIQDGNGTERVEENSKDSESNASLGAYIPVPTETFLEVLSQRLKIHPISIYWLLREMYEKEGLVCLPELKRRMEDYVSVVILKLLGYQWPVAAESGESLPDWTDNDGIIPLTYGLGEPTLLERVRKKFGADFGEEREASIESDFANILGKSLERWLEENFFARYLRQFKNRPIAWHLVSNPHVDTNAVDSKGKRKTKRFNKRRKPAFSVMVHYHRFVDGQKGYDKLLLLKNKYLEKLMSQTRQELESLRGKGDDPAVFDRIAELDRRLVELEDFRDRVERIQEGKDRESRIHVRWKNDDEQPKGWRPDINDGVKINIAPWERLGMFPVKKIVGKVEMAPEQEK